jgi:hypothetical protein
LRRQDAEDGVGHAGECDGLPEDVEVRAEAALPEAGAEHDDVGAADAIFGGMMEKSAVSAPMARATVSTMAAE